MEYNVTMPILSDTMDKGKLTKWYVREGDEVKKGDKLCEVESDKATMDIQSFHNGVIKKILVKEGEEVPVKSVIAVIEENAASSAVKTENQKPQPQQTPKEKKEPEKQKAQQKTDDINIDDIINSIVNEKPKGEASPAAKKIAKEHNINIENLQKENRLPKPAHINDIQNEILKRYFTPKALKLINGFGIDTKNFDLNHKITEEEVLNYIKDNNIPKKTDLNANQLAVINTLNNSIKKPSFFIFEEIEITKKENIKITAQIIKAMAGAMQKNPLSRSVIKQNTLITYPASNISIAVSRNDGLFMCVIKNAEDKSLEEINSWLKNIKTKKLNINDLNGSTFGISNLGMFDIESFSALINDKDCGIAAFGKMDNSKIKVTFTFDHRILNGVDAANFVNDFKRECKNV